MNSASIHCKDVPYRSGFVEITPGIHADHINLEVWNVHPDQAASIGSIEALTDEDVVAITEVELNASQTKEMICRLQQALAKIESS